MRETGRSFVTDLRWFRRILIGSWYFVTYRNLGELKLRYSWDVYILDKTAAQKQIGLKFHF